MIQRIIRPGVEIQQNFLTTNPSLVNPDLPTVIVGPNYQVAKDGAAGPYAGAALTVAYPGLEVGAKVELTTVAVKLADVVLQVVNGGANQATFVADQMGVPIAIDFITAGVQVGDVVVTTDGVDTYRASVEAVVDAQTLDLDRDIPFAAPADFYIERTNADVTLPGAAFDATADQVDIDAAIQVGGLPVMAANVLVTYRALRALTANVLTVINQNVDIAGKLGAITFDADGNCENPLALGVQLAKANTVSTVLAMGIEEDTPLGYLNALGFLQNEGVYTVVLLSQSLTVNGALNTHVNEMSKKEKSRFRMGFINLEHPTEKIAVEELELARLKRVGGIVTISQPNASFLTQARVGDIVRAIARTGANPTADPSLAGLYLVTNVNNNSTLRLASAKYAGEKGVYVVDTAIAADFVENFVDMEIIRPLDKDGQAQAIAEIANSFGNRRITYITNHEIVVNFDGTSQVVPGYYLAAAYAGMNAGNPPHQGFTNLGVAGVESVRYSNRYFNDEQLGLIAGSGGFVVVQDADGALPVAYLQTTTDNQSIQKRELSVTKTLDFYSLGLKGILTGFIGPYNIYPATLAALRNSVDGWHSFLLGQVYDRIGSPILSATIIGLETDPLEEDVVNIVTEIDIPLPLNRIRVTVNVAA